MYLLFNSTGPQYPRLPSHYDPYSPVYSPRERVNSLLSDVGVLTAFYAYYCLAQTFSWGSVVVIYGMPLLIVNYAFMFIIFLASHSPCVAPLRLVTVGLTLRSLWTIDRDYDFLKKALHHITDTHVLHHIFLTLPYYNLMEAAEAIKPVLREYYQFGDTHPIKAMWRVITECMYVNCDEGKKSKGVHWFTNTFRGATTLA